MVVEAKEEEEEEWGGQAPPSRLLPLKKAASLQLSSDSRTVSSCQGIGPKQAPPPGATTSLCQAWYPSLSPLSPLQKQQQRLQEQEQQAQQAQQLQPSTLCPLREECSTSFQVEHSSRSFYKGEGRRKRKRRRGRKTRRMSRRRKPTPPATATMRPTLARADVPVLLALPPSLPLVLSKPVIFAGTKCL